MQNYEEVYIKNKSTSRRPTTETTKSQHLNQMDRGQSTQDIKKLYSLFEIWVNAHLEALINKERNKNRYTI